jgi:hypothetical protein
MSRACALLFALAFIVLPRFAHCHGYAGDRYFPPTIEVDDPFAADEFHLVGGRRPRSDEPASQRSSVYQLGGGIEIGDGFGVSLDAVYRSANENLGDGRNGFDNLGFAFKRELVIDAKHEYAITAALGVELGGTGTNGTKSGSTYTPTLFYAKGFGDLPDSLRFLRPLAVTGALGREFTTDSQRPEMLNWGFTIQYSLLYLQSLVTNLELREPFNRLVAVIEFPVRTCLNRGCSGETTGTINPGVVWVGNGFNLAIEAVKPLNAQSGHGTGIMFQFQKFFSH